jgi:hypothetical protein
LLTSTIFAFSASISAASPQDLVPSDRQGQYSQVVEDVFLANACAKRFSFSDTPDKATAAFVAFAKEFKFPDAENLVRSFAADVKEKLDGQTTVASPALCTDLSDRLSKPER